MELFLHPLLRHLSPKLDRRDIGKLLLLCVGLLPQLLFQLLMKLDLRLILRRDHNQVRVELISGQELIVLLKHFHNLFSGELRHKLDQELGVVLKDRNTENLEDMFQLHLLLDWRLDHSMQWIKLLLFRV